MLIFMGNNYNDYIYGDKEGINLETRSYKIT